MAYYEKVSRQIYGIYLKYIAPEDIVVYSIDEVFIDATLYHYMFSGPSICIALLPASFVCTGTAAIFPFQTILVPVGKLPAAHRTDLRPHGLPVLRLWMGVVPP